MFTMPNPYKPLIEDESRELRVNESGQVFAGGNEYRGILHWAGRSIAFTYIRSRIETAERVLQRYGFSSLGRATAGTPAYTFVSDDERAKAMEHVAEALLSFNFERQRQGRPTSAQSEYWDDDAFEFARPGLPNWHLSDFRPELRLFKEESGPRS